MIIYNEIATIWVRPLNINSKRGFTLIELSIVLVIIGLIVGGVLMGRDLINAAAVRAQITQMERYNTAVTTFYLKYGWLPGDICNPTVTAFGLTARAGGAGRGDCNGRLEGACYGCSAQQGYSAAYGWNQNGETLFFWEDLTKSGLIAENFSTATDADVGTVTSSFNLYMPPARIGNGNFVYAWSGGGATIAGNGLNYFGLSAPSLIYENGNLTTSLGLTVAQAYAIDGKVDDGLPASGRVLAQYAAGGGNTPVAMATSTTTSGGNSTSCYDTTSGQYSMSQNNGAGVNCALSFQMQGAAR